MTKKITYGTLFLLPAMLGGENSNDVLPDLNHTIMDGLTHFIVEDLRSARRFLRKAGFKHDFSKIWFGELNEHTQELSFEQLIEPLKQGHDVGLLSEAGVPCLADPGADIVKIAQQKGIKVAPLTGPSSIILALMGSGFNGQNFAFHGYLPRKPKEREEELGKLERNCYQHNQTQIFIETPYRNLQMIESIIKKCKPETLLCIGCNMTLPSESVVTKSISQWAKSNHPYNKKPAVFLLFHP